MTDYSQPFGVDANGNLFESRNIGGLDVVVRYADVPETDITEVDGIRVTTALRTVIDLAVEMPKTELDRVIRDCLGRRLFTVQEAHRRVGEPDMELHRGAEVLRRALLRLFG